MKLKTPLIAALALTAFAAHAEPVRYTLEAGHTYPSFEASHMGISFWRGKFNTSKGEFTLDRAAKTGSLSVTIDTSSVDFGHNKMNEHAVGEDLFNVAKFPTATYESSKVIFKRGQPVAIEGTLTLLGVSKPVKLKVNSFTCIQHPMFKKEVCGADASGQFNRADFGMDYGLAYGGSPVVKLAIQAEGIRE
jgi:polyisoprenoid-binding protein YceI